jgi:hypothetical protein
MSSHVTSASGQESGAGLHPAEAQRRVSGQESGAGLHPAEAQRRATESAPQAEAPTEATEQDSDAS